jgi:hypothetical protein
MDQKGRVIIGLAVVCVLAIGAAGFGFYSDWQTRRELATQREEQSRIRAANEKLAAELKDAQKKLADFQAAATPSAAGEDKAAASDTVAEAPAFVDNSELKADATKEANRKKMAEMMNGPFGEMVAKNSISMMYGDLFKEMNLTSQESEQLNSILVGDQIALMRGASADKKDPKQLAAEIEQRQKVSEAKLKNLLGDDRFAQYKTYQGQLGERMIVKQFEGQLALSQNPLAAGQKQQLVQVMVEEREKYMKENAAAPKTGKMDMAAYQSTINQRISNRAGTVLSPDQLKEFNKWQQSMAQLIGQTAKAAEESKTAGD